MQIKEVAELLTGVASSALCLFALQGLPDVGTRTALPNPEPSSVPPSSVPPSAVRHAAVSPQRLGPSYDDDRSLGRWATPVASYTWNVHLDAETHKLTSKGSIRWTNTAKEPTTELFFHLYLNAFKNNQTLFLRSPFGAGRSGDKAQHFGYIDIKKLAARELAGHDLTPLMERHSPSDPKDETDIRVKLPEPLPPGQSLTLDVEFEAQLPEIVERTGYVDSYHFVAQWFPKIAKREPDGRWVHFAFHPQSEFYADFGDYHVTLDLPANFVVGATGKRTKVSTEHGRQLVRFEQRSVTDFAWVAWDGFLSHRETIAGVDTLVLHPPGFEGAVTRTLESLRGALPVLNRRFGAYPYETLTVVHPPSSALNSGGMEYPTLITTGSRWYTAGLGLRDAEIVTVHELAHQWFYGLLASDEHAWPFLDEGLTSYAESSVLGELYGQGSLLDNRLGTLDLASFGRAIAAAHGLDEVVGKPAAEFTSFGSLGALVYQRTATLLETLARVYGAQKLDQALGRYARYYRFRHPGPEQLLAALKETLGERAAANFEQAMFARGFVDYVVQNLQSVPESQKAGVFDAPEGRTSIDVDPEAAAAKVWLSRVVVSRHGDLVFPVDIELGFADGSRIVERWSGDGATHTMHHRGGSELVSVHVDPDVRVTLDSDLLNNAMRREPAPLPVTKSLSLLAAQLGLSLFGP